MAKAARKRVNKMKLAIALLLFAVFILLMIFVEALIGDNKSFYQEMVEKHGKEHADKASRKLIEDILNEEDDGVD